MSNLQTMITIFIALGFVVVLGTTYYHFGLNWCIGICLAYVVIAFLIIKNFKKKNYDKPF